MKNPDKSYTKRPPHIRDGLLFVFLNLLTLAQRATRLIPEGITVTVRWAPKPRLIGEVARRAGEVNLSVSCADSSPTRRAGTTKSQPGNKIMRGLTVHEPSHICKTGSPRASPYELRTFPHMQNGLATCEPLQTTNRPTYAKRARHVRAPTNHEPSHICKTGSPRASPYEPLTTQKQAAAQCDSLFSLS